MSKPLSALFCVIAAASFAASAPQEKAHVIWEGQIHLGDNPEAYPKIASAGMCMQVPFKADAAKKYRITVKVCDVETLAGDGHFAEVFAHFQDKKETREEKLATFRIKDNSGDDKDFAFDFSPKAALQAKPAYFSIRIRIDASIPFGLWDDFLVKQITVLQVD
jgi:hypothetical protein